MRKSYFSILIFFIVIHSLPAQISLPSFFSDGMVLQQRSTAPVWGWASPGEIITIEGNWDHQEIKTKTDSDGKWTAKLQTPGAGGPFVIKISGSEKIIINDVLVGEVWVASGQSNMEMPLKGFKNEPINNSEKIIAESDYSKIRFFQVGNKSAFTPQTQVEGSWEPAITDKVSDFSAVAYTFSLELFHSLGVPIGIIQSDWGGTVAEAWTSKSMLRELGGYDNQLDQLENSIPENYDLNLEQNEAKKLEWEEKKEKINQEFTEIAYRDDDWSKINTPSIWEDEGYPELDGVAWYRKKIEIPDTWEGKDLVLNLGPVNDNDITWFNGSRIGSTEGVSKNRRYSIPGHLVKKGEGQLAVRVTDVGNNGGIYGDREELMLFRSDAADDTLYLAGQWKFKPEIKKPIIVQPNSPNTPSVLFNAMIAPFLPYQIKGVIWYQGESNVGRERQYDVLFPALIKDWRQQWGAGDFPFYFVQIAPFPYGGDGRKGAALRDSQRRALTVKNTGMVVTLDISDTTTIHPPEKMIIGKRLANWALAKDYKIKNIVCSGPLYRGMKIKKNKIVLSFSHSENGLKSVKEGLEGFEIAGEDGDYKPAEARIKGRKIEVHSQEINRPKSVRYNWEDTAGATLFNNDDLPASTFITEE